MAEPTAEEKEAKRTAEAAAEERLRKLRDAQSGTDKFSDNEINSIGDLIKFIIKLIFGDPDAPEEENPQAPRLSLPERVSAAQKFISSGADAAWTQYKRDHAHEVPPGGIMHGRPIAESAVVTSGRGKRNTGINGASRDHKGIDIDVTEGQTAPIRATAKGMVVFSGVLNGYGHTVIIGHADDSKTLYAHMTGENMPDLKQKVDQGDIIGQLGNSSNGKIKGMKAHLHYEQIKNGEHLTPHIHGKAMHKDDILPGLSVAHNVNDGHDHDHADGAPQVVASRAPVGNPVPNLHPTAAKAAVAAVSFKPPKSAHREQPTYGNGTFEVSDVKDAVTGAANTVFARAKTAFNGLFA